MANITLEHIAETIHKPSYIAHIRLPLARQAIQNEFQKDEFFQNKDPNEFLVENLVKLLKSEEISKEDNEHLEELLVFSVLSHDKHQEALKKEEKEELEQNAKEFRRLIEEGEREEHPLYFAVKDLGDDAIGKIKSKMGEMSNIQDIANKQMNALQEFGTKMINDKEARTQMLNDLQGSIKDKLGKLANRPEALRAREAATQAEEAAKEAAKKAADAAKQTLGKFTSSFNPFGTTKKNEPTPPEGQGGKKKSKKQIKSKKGGKRKTKKNKSKKNKSKKSKK